MNRKALTAAFPATVPVLMGYLAIGMAFGLMLETAGYGVGWALLMSMTIYAGSGQYLGVSLLATGASLSQAAFLTLMINFRHLVYGLSMLEKFRGMGARKFYMIFSLTDETYALLSSARAPAGVEEHDYYFAVAMLDHSYWILGSVLGSVLGAALGLDTTGVDFAMTALFLVIAVGQWKKAGSHLPALLGGSCIQWLTPALENFHKNWPQVEMDFKSGVTFDPQPALQQGELDLVMTSDILPRSGLHYSPMFDYEVRLVLAPDHPLAAKTRITPEDLASETLLIYPVQRSRLDVWRHFLQPAGISPSLKSVDNTLLLIQMVAARMGIAALPHWVVESFERQGLVVTKTLGEGLWSRLYAAVRDGEQRQPITEAFIRSARNHACDHLPFVKSAERPTYDAPTVRPGSPARL